MPGPGEGGEILQDRQNLKSGKGTNGNYIASPNFETIDGVIYGGYILRDFEWGAQCGSFLS